MASTWQDLGDSAKVFSDRKRARHRIVEIVRGRPDWISEVPELATLLPLATASGQLAQHHDPGKLPA